MKKQVNLKQTKKIFWQMRNIFTITCNDVILVQNRKKRARSYFKSRAKHAEKMWN